jgi:hypothetical protein
MGSPPILGNQHAEHGGALPLGDRPSRESLHHVPRAELRRMQCQIGKQHVVLNDRGNGDRAGCLRAGPHRGLLHGDDLSAGRAVLILCGEMSSVVIAVPESPQRLLSDINRAKIMLKTLLMLMGLWVVTLTTWAAGLGIIGIYMGSELPPGLAGTPPSTYILLALIIAWLTHVTLKKSMEMVRG